MKRGHLHSTHIHGDHEWRLYEIEGGWAAYRFDRTTREETLVKSYLGANVRPLNIDANGVIVLFPTADR